MPGPIFLKYLLALGISLAIEIPIAILILRRFAKPLKIIAAALAGTIITHLFIHFIMIRRLHIHGLTLHLSAELFAVTVEALIYWLVVRPQKWQYAMYASICANAASYITGLLLSYFKIFF